METGKMFQMKMRVKKLSFDGEHWWEPQDPEWIVEVDETKIKGGTGKPDESRENKVKGGDNDVLYCYDKSDERR